MCFWVPEAKSSYLGSFLAEWGKPSSQELGFRRCVVGPQRCLKAPAVVCCLAASEKPSAWERICPKYSGSPAFLRQERTALLNCTILGGNSQSWEFFSTLTFASC